MLNQEGILSLATMMVKSPEMYNQNVWIDNNEGCGTACCLAGFCLVDKVGIEKARLLQNTAYSSMCDAIEAGKKKLGLDYGHHDIFGAIDTWPTDLWQKYRSGSKVGRLLAGLLALQRLREDGTIDPDPHAIYTSIPQVREICARYKKDMGEE